jgi:3-hydroxy-5-methyl-1-naphthoate 3-O-methyltransferase
MPVSQYSYQLLDLLTQYQTPAVVMAAHRLGVFRELGAAPATLDDLVSRLGLPARSLGILLRSCVALGLLQLKDGVFANGQMAAETLVPDSPGYIGRLVDKEAFFYEAWGGLAGCVGSDKAALSPIRDRARDDPEQTRNFLLALDDIMRLYGAGFTDCVSLRGSRSLLDVGGGVGSYALALVLSTPGLRATVLELPEVVPWTREFVDQAGLAGRVSVVPLDFLSEEFPEGFDTILLSNIFHDQPPTINRGLLAKAYRALPPGGGVVVYDFLLEPDRVSPATSAVFAVMMLVENQGGNVYTRADIESWLVDAGFEGVSTICLPPPSPMGVVRGLKSVKLL